MPFRGPRGGVKKGRWICRTEFKPGARLLTDSLSTSLAVMGPPPERGVGSGELLLLSSCLFVLFDLWATIHVLSM